MQDGVTQQDVSRRLELILRAAGVPNLVSVKFFKDNHSKQEGGDLDLVTTMTSTLEQNYVMGIKVSNKKIAAFPLQIFYDSSSNSLIV